MRNRSADVAGLAVLALAAVALRVAFLDARSLTFEETFSAHVAGLPWSDAWRLVAGMDSHPPLYYLLLKLWTVLGTTPAVLRFLSLLFGVLLLLPTWLLARAVGGRTVAWMAAVLLAGSALAIQASVEVRMYSLLTLLATWSTFLFFRATIGATRPWVWVGYGLVIAAALLVHYFAFFLLAAHAAYIVLYHRADRPVRLWFLIAAAITVTAYAPWWWALGEQGARVFAPQSLQGVWGAMTPAVPVNIVALASFGGYFLRLGSYLITPPWSWPQVLLIMPFLALAVLGGLRPPRSREQALLLLCWLLPLLLLLGGSLATGVHYLRPRMASFTQPFFAVLLALGLSTVARGRRRAAILAAALGVMLVLNVAALRMALADPRHQPFDWAGAAAHVRERWQPGDAVVFFPLPARIAFGYYFSGSLARSVTVMSPPPVPVLSGVELERTLPPFLASVGNADRLWFVVTEPFPRDTPRLLVQAIEQAYDRKGFSSFRRIWVFLFTKRPG